MSISARLFFGILIFCALTALPLQAESVTKLYDIDFSSPLHTVGQPPTCGYSTPVCRTVHSVVGAYVTDSVLELSQASCLLQTDTNLHSYPVSTIALDFMHNPELRDYSHIVIEMDILMCSFQDDYGFLEVGFGESIQFYPNGLARYGMNEIAYNPESRAHLSISIDQFSGFYEAYVNNNLLCESYSGFLCYYYAVSVVGAGNAAAVDNIVIYGISDSPELTITGPYRGAGLCIGEEYPITWYSSSDVQNISIEFSTDAGVTWSPVVPQNTGNTGMYNWTVPNTPSNFCKLRMTDSITDLQVESHPFRLCEPVPALPAYDAVFLDEVFGKYIVPGEPISIANDNGVIILTAQVKHRNTKAVWLNGNFSLFEDHSLIDVNNRNQAILMDNPIYSERYLYLWQNGQIVQTDALFAGEYVAGINDSGHVLIDPLSGGPILWIDGTRTTVDGLIGYNSYDSRGFNNADQIVGVCSGTDETALFLYTNSQMILPDVLAGNLYNNEFVTINGHGTVAGHSRNRIYLWKNNRCAELGPGQLVAFNDHEQYLIQLQTEYPPETINLVHGAERIDLRQAAGLSPTIELTNLTMNNAGWIAAMGHDYTVSDQNRPVLLVPQTNRKPRRINILGPEIIGSHSIVPLRAVGVCEDNCPKGLTDLVTWTVTPTQAGDIDSEGYFHIGNLRGIFEVTVTTEYVSDTTLRMSRTFKTTTRQLHVPTNYPTIQSALDDAEDFDEVILLDGVYRGEGNRDLTLPKKYIELRSLNGPSNCIIDAEDRSGFLFSSSNHYVNVSGVTITNAAHAVKTGLESTYYVNCGSFDNCRLTGNVYGIFKLAGRFTNCIISENTTGVYMSSVQLYNCTVSNNQEGCTRTSGNIFISTVTGNRCAFFHCSTNVLNSVVSGNQTGFENCGANTLCVSVGGKDCGGRISNCVVAGNTYGVVDSADCTFTNCIFWMNKEAAIACGVYRLPAIAYCNLYANACTIPVQDKTRDGVYVCDADFVNSLGNISADPLFVREGYWDDGGTPGEAGDDVWVEGDYHLQSEGWSWDVQSGQWMWNEATSPCIDAGHPAMGLGDEPLTLAVDLLNRFGTNVRINMGAYGGTAEASMAPEGWALRSDLDNSGRVTADDLAMVAAMWLDAQALLPADTTRDGIVDAADLTLMADEWLKTALRLQD